MRHRKFLFDDLALAKQRLYYVANGFDHCNVYDSNQVETALDAGKYEMLAAFGFKRALPSGIDELYNDIQLSKHWIFGHFEYHDISRADHLQGYLYEPLLVTYILKNSMELEVLNMGMTDGDFELICEQLMTLEIKPGKNISNTLANFKPQTVKEDYLRQVELIKQDIIHGKYYEMNYCIEFRSAFSATDFLPYFNSLNTDTSSPFAAFVKHPGYTLMCSSPERFMMRKGDTLLSQPIKGTNRRLYGEANVVQIAELRNSEKELAENVMIVDLVRNDMAKVCKPGTVKVDELFGTYAFKTVNHLVSSVTGKLRDNTIFKDIMYALFPMGSMTGAPKTEVMKHIDLYEHAARGIYSGCLGYIEPNGDFDFNVVIRSLYFDAVKSEISYKVGSAITYDSVAENEYEECLLKGKRLFKAMSGGSTQQ